MKGAKIISGLVLGAVLFSTGISQAAEKTYYRWQDDRGYPVHSDRPPPAGIDYEVVSTKSNMIRQVDGDDGAVPATTQPTASNRFEQVEAKKVEAKKNPEFCSRAQQNLETLETKARISIRDGDGEVRFLSEEEKENERAKARVQIASQC